jgi:mono/diheme cytochrome c family protein
MITIRMALMVSATSLLAACGQSGSSSSDNRDVSQGTFGSPNAPTHVAETDGVKPVEPAKPNPDPVNPDPEPPNPEPELTTPGTLDPAVVAVIALAVDRTTIATEAAGPGVPNYLHQVVISPDGGNAVVPSKKDNVVDGTSRSGLTLRHDTTVRSILSKLDLKTGKEVFAEQVDFNNQAPVRAAAYTPSGNYVFVAHMESNRIQIVDPYTNSAVGVISGTTRTPHGFYVDPTNQRLFVNNFLDRSVTSHDIRPILAGTDLVTPSPVRIATVDREPLSAAVLEGKQIFFNAADPRMSNESYISCASCHFDGDSDDTIWDFTQRGEGQRRTISLEGKAGIGEPGGKLHWSGNFDEVHDFENDIRGEFGGTGFMANADFERTRAPLGEPKAGLSPELDRLVAYVSSLEKVNRSPYRDFKGCLTPEAQKGKAVFEKASCTSCHGTAQVADNERHDVGTLQASSGKGSGQPLAGVGIDTPTLYGLWENGSYLHNGQAKTLEEVFRPEKLPDGVTSTANYSAEHGGAVVQSDVAALVQYLKSRDSDEICVGVS